MGQSDPFVLLIYWLFAHVLSQIFKLIKSVLFWLLQCSDKLGLSLELGSFAAGVMISTTDLAQHTLEQVRSQLSLLELEDLFPFSLDTLMLKSVFCCLYIYW